MRFARCWSHVVAMGATLLTAALLVAAVDAQHTPGQYPPGWNKVAMTPPMVRLSLLDPPPLTMFILQWPPVGSCSAAAELSSALCLALFLLLQLEWLLVLWVDRLAVSVLRSRRAGARGTRGATASPR